MKVVDAWVTTMVAVATVATCLLVYWAAKPSWSVGSMGEWVSGFGSLGAVIVAILMTNRQLARAHEQFSAERDHALQMRDEERRYQETLAAMEARQRKEDAASLDYKRGQHLVADLASGFSIASQVIGGIKAHPTEHKLQSNVAKATRTFIAANNAADFIVPDNFSNSAIYHELRRLRLRWHRVTAVFDVMSAVALTPLNVKEIALDKDVPEAFIRCMLALAATKPDYQLDLEKAELYAETWTKAHLIWPTSTAGSADEGEA